MSNKPSSTSKTNKNSPLGAVHSALLGPSRVYSIEYLAVLLSLALITLSAVGLFNALATHFVSDDSGMLSGLFSYETLIGYIAVAVVAIPAFLIFYTRTRKAERLFPPLRDVRARRRLGYLFQLIAALFIVGYAVALSYTILYSFVSPAGTNNDGVLQAVASQAFTIAFVAYTATFISRMSPGVSSNSGGK